MRFKYSFVIATFLFAGRGFAASKEMQELQRDVAQLQDQVRTLQSGFDTKMAALQVLVQQALDAASKANTNVSVLSSGVNDTLDRALRERLTPITGVAAKVDNIGNDVSDVRNSMADLTAQINKLQSQLNDINNAVKSFQPPAAAPPAGGAGTGSTPPGLASNGGPPPPAETVFNNAYRDETGGKLELALGEYADFLKFYPQDPNAAGAQFRIGEIHYTQGHMDDAVRDFDAVIERFPNGQNTPDAYFMKGMALKQSGHKEAAATDFRALIAKFASSPQAQQAKEQLRTMGYSVSGSPTRKKR
jgi:TolA-binding protein